MPYSLGDLKKDPKLENYPFKALNLGVRVSGFWFRVEGLGFKALSLELRVLRLKV